MKLTLNDYFMLHDFVYLEGDNGLKSSFYTIEGRMYVTYPDRITCDGQVIMPVGYKEVLECSDVFLPLYQEAQSYMSAYLKQRSWSLYSKAVRWLEGSRDYRFCKSEELCHTPYRDSRLLEGSGVQVYLSRVNPSGTIIATIFVGGERSKEISIHQYGCSMCSKEFRKSEILDSLEKGFAYGKVVRA